MEEDTKHGRDSRIRGIPEAVGWTGDPITEMGSRFYSGHHRDSVGLGWVGVALPGGDIAVLVVVMAVLVMVLSGVVLVLVLVLMLVVLLVDILVSCWWPSWW